jgi:hypothetical protein
MKVPEIVILCPQLAAGELVNRDSGSLEVIVKQRVIRIPATGPERWMGKHSQRRGFTG